MTGVPQNLWITLDHLSCRLETFQALLHVLPERVEVDRQKRILHHSLTRAFLAQSARNQDRPLPFF